jgi:predicted transcriptional regulator
MAKKTSYTITEAAKKLGVTRAAVHLAIKKKRLSAKWGKTTQIVEALLIDPKDLEVYRVDLERQRSGKKS